MSLKFPLDLTDRYYFDMKFMTYSRPNPFSGKINLLAPSWFGSSGVGSVRLPVPAHMVDSQNLKWVQEENLDGFVGAATEAITGDHAGGLAGMGAEAALAIQKMSSIIQSVGFNTVGDLAGYALQRAGLSLNPVLTQTFKHPEFKVHQFSWKLAPNDPNESHNLQLIIDNIKLNSLPDMVAGGAFFSYPSIALIKIHSGNNGNLYNFQPCVITNVTTNYAPQGVPSFFAGTNAPTMVQLDLALVEIILNTRSNMGDASGNGFESFFDASLGQLGNATMKIKELERLKGQL